MGRQQRRVVRVIAKTSERKRKQKEQATGPTFSFSRALPDGMTREEAKQRTLEAVAALAERGGR